MSSRKKTSASVKRINSVGERIRGKKAKAAITQAPKLGKDPTQARAHLEAYAQDLAEVGGSKFGEGSILIARAAEFRQLARIATDEQVLSIRDQLYDAKELVVFTCAGGDA